MGRQRRPRHHRSVVVCSDRQPLIRSSASRQAVIAPALADPAGRHRSEHRQIRQAVIDPGIGNPDRSSSARVSAVPAGRCRPACWRRPGAIRRVAAIRDDAWGIVFAQTWGKHVAPGFAVLRPPDGSRRGSYETALDGLFPADRAGSSRRETYGCRIGFAVEKPPMAVTVEESFIGRYGWRELRMTVTVE